MLEREIERVKWSCRAEKLQQATDMSNLGQLALDQFHACSSHVAAQAPVSRAFALLPALVDSYRHVTGCWLVCLNSVAESPTLTCRVPGEVRAHDCVLHLVGEVNRWALQKRACTGEVEREQAEKGSHTLYCAYGLRLVLPYHCTQHVLVHGVRSHVCIQSEWSSNNCGVGYVEADISNNKFNMLVEHCLNDWHT